MVFGDAAYETRLGLHAYLYSSDSLTEIKDKICSDISINRSTDVFCCKYEEFQVCDIQIGKILFDSGVDWGIDKSFFKFFGNKRTAKLFNDAKIKSLNYMTPNEIKTSIATSLNIDINKVKLFGSRIVGNYSKFSDLDVGINDYCPIEWQRKGIILNNIEIELHWLKEKFQKQFITHYI